MQVHKVLVLSATLGKIHCMYFIINLQAWIRCILVILSALHPFVPSTLLTHYFRVHMFLKAIITLNTLCIFRHLGLFGGLIGGRGELEGGFYHFIVFYLQHHNPFPNPSPSSPMNVPIPKVFVSCLPCLSLYVCVIRRWGGWG